MNSSETTVPLMPSQKTNRNDNINYPHKAIKNITVTSNFGSLLWGTYINFPSAILIDNDKSDVSPIVMDAIYTQDQFHQSTIHNHKPI